jgi:hypothetical protein
MMKIEWSAAYFGMYGIARSDRDVWMAFGDLSHASRKGFPNNRDFCL